VLGPGCRARPALALGSDPAVVPLVQQVTLPKKPVQPVQPGVSRTQSVERFKGMAAALIRIVLLPPHALCLLMGFRPVPLLLAW